MYNGQKIKDLISRKKLRQKDVYEGCNISQASFNTIVSDTANPTAKNLEALADFLCCSIDDFFDRKNKTNITSEQHVSWDEITAGDISLSVCQKEIEHLKQMLIEKERTIKILMNQIGIES